MNAYPGRFSVGELFDGGPERAADLTADGHLVFDWELVTAPWSAEAWRSVVDRRERLFGPDRRPTLVLSNHDQPRHASRLATSAGTDDVDAIAKAAAVLLLGLRGTPFLYYGEEIGMVDVPIPADEIVDPPARLAGPEFPWWNRDQCRTPMAWTGEPGAGFTTGRPWIRIGDDARRRNVAAEEADPALRPRDVPAAAGGEAIDRGAAARRLRVARRRRARCPRLAARDRRLAGDRLGELRRRGAARRSSRGRIAIRAAAGTHLDPPIPGADGVLTLRPLEGVILTGT